MIFSAKIQSSNNINNITMSYIHVTVSLPHNREGKIIVVGSGCVYSHLQQ